MRPLSGNHLLFGAIGPFPATAAALSQRSRRRFVVYEGSRRRRRRAGLSDTRASQHSEAAARARWTAAPGGSSPTARLPMDCRWIIHFVHQQAGRHSGSLSAALILSAIQINFNHQSIGRLRAAAGPNLLVPYPAGGRTRSLNSAKWPISLYGRQLAPRPPLSALCHCAAPADIGSH